MSRVDQEPRPSVEICPGTIEQVKVFFEHLQQTYEYHTWVTEAEIQNWQAAEKENKLDIYIARHSISQAVIGVAVLEKAFDNGAHALFLISDKAFGSLRIGTMLGQHIKSQYRWITLVAAPLIQEMNISEEELVKFYTHLGFKEIMRGFRGTQMKWTQAVR